MFKDCKKNREQTWKRFRADKMDLLMFTDGSANEECSDIGSIQNRTIESKCELRSVFKEKLLEQKEKLH